MIEWKKLVVLMFSLWQRKWIWNEKTCLYLYLWFQRSGGHVESNVEIYVFYSNEKVLEGTGEKYMSNGQIMKEDWTRHLGWPSWGRKLRPTC